MGEWALSIAFIDPGDKGSEIKELIESDDRFTDTFRLPKATKSKTIYAISLTHGTINYVAMGRKSGRIATYKDRITFTNFLPLDLPIENLLVNFPQLAQRIGALTPGGVMNLPPVLSRLIILWLSDKNIDFSHSYLNALHNGETVSRHIGEMEQQDAIMSALELADFYLHRTATTLRTSGKMPEFLSLLSDSQLSEDEIITHDFSVFGEWTRHHVVGTACFQKNDEYLYIWNVNRKPLETVLGVDLIYYVEEYGSFIMVQYKRMVREGDKWVYRPTDNAYHREIQRMKEFAARNVLDEVSSDLEQYRLSNNPFYFKLCKSKVDITDTQLISGMYLPLTYWEKLVDHPTVARGKQGGLGIGYHNAQRWLTRTDFKSLVQKGWIGSQAAKSEILSELIESALHGERAVILAEKLHSRLTSEIASTIESN